MLKRWLVGFWLPLFWLLVLITLLFNPAYANGGKLLGTAGTTSFEGGAGGGIVPWAVLSGYDTQEQYSLSAFATHLSLSDYGLTAKGLSLGVKDRLAMTFARQDFSLKALNTTISQQVYGVKLRLLGDVIYSAYPQVSVGIYHKKLLDKNIASAVGASNTRAGNDIYLSATKLHLGLANGFNVLWNITARNTKANQAGFLGYGGDNNRQSQWHLEGSAAILFNRNIAVGFDYRDKPNNLSFVKEQAWRDIFIAWFPNKRANLTFAWAELGSIANSNKQQGAYLSLTLHGG